jgi:Rrf2 family protein
MKLSTRARYGMRLLIDLALHYDEQPVPLKDIARRQKISLQYLQHIVTALVAGGMVFTTRGARGGVVLARPPEDIKVSEAIRLLQGSVAPTDCVDNPEICERSKTCVTRDLWCEMKTALDGVLNSTSLKDLVERQKLKEQQDQTIYSI